MDIQAMKLDLIKWLVELKDPQAIMTFLQLRKEIEKIEQMPNLKPMTKEELIKRAIESNEAIDKNDVFDIDDLAKEYLRA